MNRSHEYQPPIVWTKRKDSLLIHARVTRQLGWKRVAKVMGHAEITCQRRARVLGIAAPLRRIGAFTPQVKREIMRRRAAGQSFRAIAMKLGVGHTDVWRHYQDMTSSAAAKRAASEVRQGPVAWAPGKQQGASRLLDVPPLNSASSRSSGGAASFGGND